MVDNPDDNLLSFREFQALLINNGFGMPKYGADGFYGSESAAAIEEWARSGMELTCDFGEPSPPVEDGDDLVPASWMQDCDMDRIILHWTAGASFASDHDRGYYHILIEADGTLVQGKKKIIDNVSTSDGVYAAHTSQFNTKSIGISLCGMAGARESPFYAGTSPINEAQWKVAARVAAELARKYKIPVDKTHVLSHGRVQANCGIPQSGKWDVCELPWNRSIHGEACDEAWREHVRAWM
jgi:hypothetical protein